LEPFRAIGRGVQDMGTGIRRGGENLWAGLSHFNPIPGSQGNMAIRYGQSAQDLGHKIKQLQNEREFMQNNLGNRANQFSFRNIDRDIARAQKDQQRYITKDKSLSANAMNWNKYNPAAQMQMMQRRDEQLGFHANNHLVQGRDANKMLSSQAPRGPSGPSPMVSGKQHAQTVRQGLRPSNQNQVGMT